MLFETIFQDARYPARILRRNTGFTFVAVFALAVGIGVNTTVFTAYKSTVARSLDARNPTGLVNLALTRQSGAADFKFSCRDYEVYRDRAHSFTGLIAFSPKQLRLSDAGAIVSQRTSAAGSRLGRLGLLSRGASNAEFASSFVVSENYFNVLGVAAARGRTFDAMSPNDLVAAPAVLISDNYWRRRFANDAGLLGTTVRLNAVPVTIIGVTPHDFTGTGIAVPDFWVPISIAPLIYADSRFLHDRESQYFRLFGRLAPGIGIRQAQAELILIADHIGRFYEPRSEAAKPSGALVWPGSPFRAADTNVPGTPAYDRAHNGRRRDAVGGGLRECRQPATLACQIWPERITHAAFARSGPPSHRPTTAHGQRSPCSYSGSCGAPVYVDSPENRRDDGRRSPPGRIWDAYFSCDA